MTSSDEAIETAIRQVLSSRGPLSEEELLEALLVDRVDLGGYPEDSLATILENTEELIMSLVDGRWVLLSALLEGRVFTHRLSEVEVEHDLIEFGPDLAPVSFLTEDETYQSLVDGSAIFDAMPGADDEELAERGVPVDELGPEGGWLLEPGHFAALGVNAGDVVGIRVTDAGFELIAVTETTESPIGSRLSDLLEEHFDSPQMLGVAVWSVCAEDDVLLREPSAPLGELLEASGLPQSGDWIAKRGFSFDSWRTSSRLHTITSRYDLRDDEALALLAAVKIHEHIHEMVDAELANAGIPDDTTLRSIATQLINRPRSTMMPTEDGEELDPDYLRDILAFLAEPIVAEAFLTETGPSANCAALALEVFAEITERPAPRSARPALRWLRGKAREALGDVEKAEQIFREAELLDDSWPLTLTTLARYASDRGDAVRGLSLLRRSGAPDGDPLVRLLESVQPTTGPTLGRNQPCWCGSGRKYKQCHLHGQQLSLEERASWLYQKAESHMLDGPFVSLLIATAEERSQYLKGPNALTQAVQDGLVADAVLFEGGAFAEFLTMRGPLLPADEAMLAQQWLLVDRSVREVLIVKPGQSMEWRDVRTGDVQMIQERTASRQVKAGELYCSRVVPVGETTQIFGGLEPVSIGERDQLIALLDSDPDPLELVAFLSRRFAPPVLVNTEHEASVMCDATLQITDPGVLAKALDDEYTRDVAASAETLRWFEHITSRGVEKIRAQIELKGDQLTVHANSEERFERVLTVIGALNPTATTISETREPAGDLQSLQKLSGFSPESGDEPFDPSSDPAMMAALQEMVLNHERAWLDDSIPALGGHTPRQCAEDPTRRPDLIKLLASFPEDDGQPGTMSPARLRSALGLD